MCESLTDKRENVVLTRELEAIKRAPIKTLVSECKTKSGLVVSLYVLDHGTSRDYNVETVHNSGVKSMRAFTLIGDAVKDYHIEISHAIRF